MANALLSIIAVIIDNVAGFTFPALPYGFFYFANILLTLIPGLAAAVRRLHDVGKSGWFILIAIIPLIGSIWLLILFCKSGDEGTNQYGVNPKNSFDEIEEIGSPKL